jgi:hypothetical protein
MSQMGGRAGELGGVQSSLLGNISPWVDMVRCLVSEKGVRKVVTRRLALKNGRIRKCLLRAMRMGCEACTHSGGQHGAPRNSSETKSSLPDVD